MCPRTFLKAQLASNIFKKRLKNMFLILLLFSRCWGVGSHAARGSSERSGEALRCQGLLNPGMDECWMYTAYVNDYARTIKTHTRSANRTDEATAVGRDGANICVLKRVLLDGACLNQRLEMLHLFGTWYGLAKADVVTRLRLETSVHTHVQTKSAVITDNVLAG